MKGRGTCTFPDRIQSHQRFDAWMKIGIIFKFATTIMTFTNNLCGFQENEHELQRTQQYFRCLRSCIFSKDPNQLFRSSFCLFMAFFTHPRSIPCLRAHQGWGSYHKSRGVLRGVHWRQRLPAEDHGGIHDGLHGCRLFHNGCLNGGHGSHGGGHKRQGVQLKRGGGIWRGGRRQPCWTFLPLNCDHLCKCLYWTVWVIISDLEPALNC